MSLSLSCGTLHRALGWRLGPSCPTVACLAQGARKGGGRRWQVDGAFSGRGGLEGAGSLSPGAGRGGGVTGQAHMRRLRRGGACVGAAGSRVLALWDVCPGQGADFPPGASAAFQFPARALQQGGGGGGDGHRPDLPGLTLCGESRCFWCLGRRWLGVQV